MAIIKFPTAEDFDPEQISALAEGMLARGKAAESVKLLNRFGLKDMRSDKVRGIAFAELSNYPVSNYYLHRALKKYLAAGGNVKDASVKPVVRELVSNNIQMQNAEAVGYYFGLVKDTLDFSSAPDGEKKLLERAFRDFAMSLQSFSMPVDGLEGEPVPDDNVFAILQQARALVDKGKSRQAVNYLLGKIDQAGEYTCEFYRIIARCCLKFDCEKAIFYADKVLEVVSTDVSALCIKFSAAYVLGDTYMTDEVADRLIDAVDSDDLKGLRDIFAAFVSCGYYGKLLELARSLAVEDPDYYYYNKMYAIALNLCGRREEALKVINAQVALMGDTDDAKFVKTYLEKYADCMIRPTFYDFAPVEMAEDMKADIDAIVRMLPMRTTAGGTRMTGSQRDLKNAILKIKDKLSAYEYFVRFGIENCSIDEKLGIITFAIFLCDSKQTADVREFVADMLLDDDITPALKEEIITCMFLYSDASVIYYVHNGRMYRMNTRAPRIIENSDLLFRRAYVTIRVTGAMEGKYSQRQLDDAVERVMAALISQNKIALVEDYQTFVKMVMYYLGNAGAGDNKRVLEKATDIDFVDKQDDYELFT